ncbi:hypothetical protein Leryth_008116 [Lithospermum erythrorhizon]|nr:hypothetical protein Leryth_008116 [Lithospermum erythrorhizon]
MQEMKSQCEAKRLAHEEALKIHKEMGKLKSGKVDRFPSQNLQAASDDYDQEVNSLLFRMRSLKQGQYRSLLTQAARHHAAQLSFFKKAYLCLESIEPYVKSVAKDHHIDYEFSGLEDDSGDEDDGDYGVGNDGDVTDSGSSDDSELSFSNTQDHPRHYTRKPMEDVEQLSPNYNTIESRKDFRPSSMSAPLFSDRRFDPNFKPIQMRSSSSKKHATYALPTPPGAKSPVSVKLNPGVSQKRHPGLSSLNSYYSSPLDKNKYEKPVTNDVLSGPLPSDTKAVLRDSNQNIQSRPLPPPLLNGFSPPQVEPIFSSNPKKVKIYAFSGPLTGKQWQHKPTVTASGPIYSAGHPILSGPLLPTPRDRPLPNAKLPSHTSNSFLSSPKISELHELPRPPPHLPFKRPSPHFDYSEPLRPKLTELSTGNKVEDSSPVSTLPLPPPLNRSYSIPTRGPLTEPMAREIPAPLTPIPESRMQPATPTA